MDDLFFYASKLIWLLISPDSLFLILMVIALLLLYTGRQMWGRRLLTVLTLALIAVAVFPIGNWLLYPLEARFTANPELPQDVDGIIILGGAVMPRISEAWGQLETNQYAERLSAGIALARRYPTARVVFTGGSASMIANRPTEADMVEDHLISEGIQQDRLILERQSRNTAENAFYTKKLIKPRGDETWLLVTTAFHMPRSVGLFCKRNWPVIPVPVDHGTLPDSLFQPGFNLSDHAGTLVDATHEWVGLLAYYLSGRTDSLLPSGCRG
jgi:uncharacterized SAM-binding protein YcdF (DUF218 family)